MTEQASTNLLCRREKTQLNLKPACLFSNKFSQTFCGPTTWFIYKHKQVPHCKTLFCLGGVYLNPTLQSQRNPQPCPALWEGALPSPASYTSTLSPTRSDLRRPNCNPKPTSEKPRTTTSLPPSSPPPSAPPNPPPPPQQRRFPRPGSWAGIWASSRTGPFSPRASLPPWYTPPLICPPRYYWWL